MDLEVVTVGTELLLGFTLDGNTADIGRLLSGIGCNVVRSTSVHDDDVAIRDAVSGALSRERFVIVTGGLGPTRDDVTKKAVAEIFDAPLEVDEAYLAKLQKRFSRYGPGPMPERNRTQAEIPRGAIALANERGTALGLWLGGDLGTVVLLPGVPEEMRHLLEAEVVPRLREMLKGVQNVTRSRTLRTVGVGESRLAEELSAVESRLENVSLAYLPGLDGLDLRLTVSGVSETEAQLALERAESLIAPTLGDRFYGTGSTTLAAVLIEKLKDSGRRIAVAESCTGGTIGTRLTSVPGASDVFAGGIICYENTSKVRDLGVPSELLEKYGAVSEPVAAEMANGACERFQADTGVAVTGIAGPGGGTAEKPVGTVWLAAKAGSAVKTVERWFPGKRREVQCRSAQGAMDLLRRLLDGA